VRGIKCGIIRRFAHCQRKAEGGHRANQRRSSDLHRCNRVRAIGGMAQHELDPIERQSGLIERDSSVVGTRHKRAHRQIGQ
jgi:hypothetical protein